MKPFIYFFSILICTFSYSEILSQKSSQNIKAALIQALQEKLENSDINNIETLLDSLERVSNKGIQDQKFIAELNEKTAFLSYEKDHELSVKCFEKAAKYYLGSEHFKKAGFCFQSAAFVYDEKIAAYQLALGKVDDALKIWEKLQDTLNEANMLKYKGMLLGKLMQFEEAKKEVNDAIKLFKQLNYEQGVAVSWFDYGIIYKYENELDSAFYFFQKAKSFWTEKNNLDRIFGINIDLLEIHFEQDEPAKFEVLYLENQEIESSQKIYHQQLRDFYEIAIVYFSKQNNTQEVVKLQEKELSLKTFGG